MMLVKMMPKVCKASVLFFSVENSLNKKFINERPNFSLVLYITTDLHIQ